MTPSDAPDASLTEREAVLQVIDGAFDEISRICKERWNGTGDWRTSIPARPEWDSDLIIGDALRAARSLITGLGRFESAVKQPCIGCGGPMLLICPVCAAKQAEAETGRLREALLNLKRGACWCEVGIGNPMVRGVHSNACQRALDVVGASRPGEPQP